MFSSAADRGLVAHQDGVGDTLLVGGVYGFQNGVVLRGGYGQLLFAAGFHFCDQVLKIHGTAPRSIFLNSAKEGHTLTC